jgi:hypothetical protein
MTSKERHEIRYQRRKQKRLERKQYLNNMYGDFDKAVSVDSLIKSYRKCRKNTKWKASVQNYGFRLLRNSYSLNQDLLNGVDTFKKFYCFTVSERGKQRHIRSIGIRQRVAEKALAQNSFIPMLTNSLIYDNSASLKGRGTNRARKRLLQHLRKWYRWHGTDGYVIVGDFKSYFDSIDHDVLLGLIKSKFDDERFSEYVAQQIKHYGEIGLGLGSELNQIYAVSVPNRLDQFIKTKLRIKFYHRYNDDFYVFCETKADAWRILDEICVILAELRINLNRLKTQIVKLSHGFTFLKKRYWLSDSGKVIIKHCNKNITRERKKLKSFYKMGLSYDIVSQQYQSWRGYLKSMDSASKNYSKRYKYEYRTIVAMDKLYNELFVRKENENVCTFESGLRCA